MLGTLGITLCLGIPPRRVEAGSCLQLRHRPYRRWEEYLLRITGDDSILIGQDGKMVGDLQTRLALLAERSWLLK